MRRTKESRRRAVRSIELFKYGAFPHSDVPLCRPDVLRWTRFHSATIGVTLHPDTLLWQAPFSLTGRLRSLAILARCDCGRPPRRAFSERATPGRRRGAAAPAATGGGILVRAYPVMKPGDHPPWGSRSAGGESGGAKTPSLLEGTGPGALYLTSSSWDRVSLTGLGGRARSLLWRRIFRHLRV